MIYQFIQDHTESYPVVKMAKSLGIIISPFLNDSTGLNIREKQMNKQIKNDRPVSYTHLRAHET